MVYGVPTQVADDAIVDAVFMAPRIDDVVLETHGCTKAFGWASRCPEADLMPRLELKMVPEKIDGCSLTLSRWLQKTCGDVRETTPLEQYIHEDTTDFRQRACLRTSTCGLLCCVRQVCDLTPEHGTIMYFAPVTRGHRCTLLPACVSAAMRAVRGFPPMERLTHADILTCAAKKIR